MIFLTALTLPLWLISIYVNYYLKVENVSSSLALLIPVILVSMFVAKIITQPLARIFEKIDEDTGTIEDFKGKLAITRIAIDKQFDGQIELENRGATIVLHARTYGNKIDVGEQVLIIDYIENDKIYIVETFNIK